MWRSIIERVELKIIGTEIAETRRQSLWKSIKQEPKLKMPMRRVCSYSQFQLFTTAL